MDRKQLGITAQACWIISSMLWLSEQAYATDSVPADLEFLEWLGESLEVRDVGIDMDAVLADYERQQHEKDDANQSKENSQ